MPAERCLGESRASRHELPGRRALVISVALHLVLLGIFAGVHMPGVSSRHMPGVVHITLRRQVLAATVAPAAPSTAVPVPAMAAAKKTRAGQPPASTTRPAAPTIVSTPAAPAVPPVSTAVATLHAANTTTAAPSGPAPAAGIAQPIASSGTARESAAASNTAAAFTPASADAAYLDNPRPEYPALARQRQQEGLVTLRVEVDASGKPQQVSVLNSSRYSLLDEAAVAAVSLWRFVPARRGGEAVADTVRVPVRFSLRG